MTIPDEIVALPVQEAGAAEPQWTLELRARPARGVYLANQRRVSTQRGVPVLLLRRKYRLRLWRRVNVVFAEARDVPTVRLAIVSNDTQRRFAVRCGPLEYVAFPAENYFEITATAVFAFSKSAHLATFEVVCGQRVLRSSPFTVACPYPYRRKRGASRTPAS